MARQKLKIDQVENLQTTLNDKVTDTQLSNKQDTLVSGTNIKTVNGTSLLGSGDITISGGSELTYLNNPKYLRAFMHPIFGVTNPASLGGMPSFSNVIATNSVPANYTTHGIWAAYPQVNIITNGTAANNQYFIMSNSAGISRNGYSRSIVHMHIGTPLINKPVSSSIVLAGFQITGSTNNLGTLNNFSQAGNSYGVGWSHEMGHTNLQLIYLTPTPSVVRTIVDLGYNFPIPSQENYAAYEIIFDDLGTTANVKVTVKRIGTSHVYENTVAMYNDQSVGAIYKPFIQIRSIDAPQKYLAVGDLDIYYIV